MSDEHLAVNTFRDEADRLVDYWLRRVFRLAELLGSPSSLALESIVRTHRDPTVPGTALCQVADVSRMLVAISRRGSEHFVHPAAAFIVVEARVRGDLYAEIATRHRVARHDVTRIVRASTAALAAQMWCADLNGTYLPQEIAA